MWTIFQSCELYWYDVIERGNFFKQKWLRGYRATAVFLKRGAIGIIILMWNHKVLSLKVCADSRSNRFSLEMKCKLCTLWPGKTFCLWKFWISYWVCDPEFLSTSDNESKSPRLPQMQPQKCAIHAVKDILNVAMTQEPRSSAKIVPRVRISLVFCRKRKEMIQTKLEHLDVQNRTIASQMYTKVSTKCRAYKTLERNVLN